MLFNSAAFLTKEHIITSTVPQPSSVTTHVVSGLQTFLAGLYNLLLAEVEDILNDRLPKRPCTHKGVPLGPRKAAVLPNFY